MTGRSTGHPVRALRNKMTKSICEKEQAGAPFEELEHLTLGGLRRAVVDGDVAERKRDGRTDRRYDQRRTYLSGIDPEAGLEQTDELIGGKDSMSKIAFIFPGQGAQKAGMGKDFYENSKIGETDVIDRASERLNWI
ncbi:MAG: hypothetical protein ACLU80_15195 [Dorea sp.]